MSVSLPHGRQRVNARTWPDEKIDRLCAMIAGGHRQVAIADALGVTTSALAGQMSRMRALGDPRIPAIGDSPATPGSRRRAAAGAGPADRLAEQMAAGCSTLLGAAMRLGMSLDRAEQLWREICRGLGAQAA